eukprot:UN23685
MRQSSLSVFLYLTKPNRILSNIFPMWMPIGTAVTTNTASNQTSTNVPQQNPSEATHTRSPQSTPDTPNPSLNNNNTSNQDDSNTDDKRNQTTVISTTDKNSSEKIIINAKKSQPTNEIYGVFVGDLPTDVDEKDLMELFSQVGPVVKCKVIRNPQTGISKRYGFVHFANERLRKQAIQDMHSMMFKGQTIIVRTQHYKETDRCLVKPGTRNTDIYIGNISRDLGKAELK